MKYQPLIVDSDYRVLAVTPERKHLLWLVEGECDCQLVLGVHELSKEDLADLLAHPWNWSYKPSSMQNNLVKSPNDNVKERSLMLQNKLWAYYDVLTIINYARVRVSPVVNQQDLVYLEKERQARQVRFGITDDCQMVRDYADFANCTLTQAAEQILFKAELARDTYANTERLRMEYLRDLRKCNTLDEIKQLKDKMFRESWLNVLL
jgi:hypothetical protein